MPHSTSECPSATFTASTTQISVIAIVIALVTAITYGGLIWGVLPLRSYISFESHLFGLIAGVIVVWLERKFGKPNTKAQ